MPVYVDSAAGGANDGTSWTDAYVSLTSTTSVAAGTEIWIDDGHDETAASFSLNWSNGTAANPVRIICVDKATDLLSTGAVIRTTAANNSTHNITLAGNVFCHGVVWQMANLLTLTGGLRAVFESCTFEQNFDRSTTGSTWQFGPDGIAQNRIILSNCTLDRSIRTTWLDGALRVSRTVILRIVNPTIVPASSTNGVFMTAANSNNVSFLEVFNADLSAFDTPLDLRSVIASFSRCNLKTGFTVTKTTAVPGDRVIFEQCDDGTISVPPLGLAQHDTFYGKTCAVLSRYRTGGANDGEQANAYSWEMVSNANALEIYSPLESPPLVVWAEPDASISGATAKGIHHTSRCAPRATPAALTTDAASTWNGSDVGTKQQISVTLTNGDTLTVFVASGGTLNNDDFWIEASEPDQVGGPVSVRCFLAKPSTTVYVDPYPVIT